MTRVFRDLLLITAMGMLLCLYLDFKPGLLIIPSLAIVFGLFPATAGYFHMIWMKLGYIIGYIPSKIILTTLYIVVLTPTALVWRLSKNNTKKFSRNEQSQFQENNHTFKKEDLVNEW